MDLSCIRHTSQTNKHPQKKNIHTHTQSPKLIQYGNKTLTSLFPQHDLSFFDIQAI